MNVAEEKAVGESLELVKGWLQRGNGSLLGGQGSVVGVDIGSYGLRAIVADLEGSRIQGASRPLPDGDADQITTAGIALLNDVLADSGTNPQQLVRIGIGFGGPVDADAAVTRIHYRRPGWERFPLVERFESAFDAPVLLDNDANVIALGEACCGAGQDTRDLFYLLLSTGVGGGVVLDGRLYHGASTTAGEIGHATVKRDGAPCSCGGKGHLESYVSVRALLRRLGELGVETNELSQVFSDDPAAKQTVAEATDLLGLTLANVVTLLDPQVIVVGGIVARTVGEGWLRQLASSLQEALPPTLVHDVPIKASTFNQDSVAIGALALALSSLQE
jgi:glucokinase